MPRKERATSTPLIRAFIGRLLWGRTPGAGEQGSEGSLQGMRGGEGCYSQGGVLYKEESGSSAVIGVHGSRSAPNWMAWAGRPPRTCLRHFFGHASTRLGMPQHARLCPTQVLGANFRRKELN